MAILPSTQIEIVFDEKHFKEQIDSLAKYGEKSGIVCLEVDVVYRNTTKTSLKDRIKRAYRILVNKE